MAENRCLSCMELMPQGSSACPKCGNAVPCPPNDVNAIQPGTLLNGRFRIGRQIGRGGFGITYVAWDEHLQVARAVKEFFPKKGCQRADDLSPIIQPGYEATFEKNRAHFLHEARMMTQVERHHVEGVVSIVDQFDLNGTSYILMELLTGCALDAYIVNNGALTPEQTMGIMRPVLNALSSLHKAGVIHRDISLSNIFLTSDGGVKLIDLGSSQRIEKAENTPEALWPSKKQDYSPLEQMNRQKQGPYSDIYAAAVCFYKSIMMRSPGVLPGDPLPSISSELQRKDLQKLDSVLAKATARNAADRLQTVDEMIRLLYPKQRKKLPIVLGLLGAVIVALAAIVLPGINPVDTGATPPAVVEVVNYTKIEISDLADGQKIKSGGSFVLKGKATPSQTVVITIDGEPKFETKADVSGSWVHSFEADAYLKANASTAIGVKYKSNDDQQYQQELRVFRKTLDKAVIQANGAVMADSAANVVVKGEAGAEVILKVDGREVRRGTVAVDGRFSFENIPLDVNNVLSVEMRDEVGNVTNSDSQTVAATQPPRVEEVVTPVVQVVETTPPPTQVPYTPITMECSSIRNGRISENYVNRVLIEGEALPGTNLVITVNGYTDYKASVTSDGRWELTIPQSLIESAPSGKVDVVVKYQGYDAISSQIGFEYVTMVKPTLDGPVSEDAKTVTGRAQPDAKVILMDFEGIELSKQTTVQSDGSYTIELTQPLQAGAVIYVMSDDGYNYKDSDSLQVQAHQRKLLKADRIGNAVVNADFFIHLSGEPNETVTAAINGQSQTIKLNRSGSAEWNISVAQLPEGRNLFTVNYADDEAANEITIQVKVDRQAELMLQSRIVYEDTTSISGMAEEDTKIVVRFKGKEIKAKTDSRGAFVVPLGELLKDGAGETLEITAEDALGNKTQDTLEVKLPDMRPILIRQAGNGSVLPKATFELRGEAEPGAALVLTTGGIQVNRGTVGSDGQFVIDYPVAAITQHPADEQFNVSYEIAYADTRYANLTAKGYVTMDAACRQPTVDEPISAGTETITGTAQPGSKVALLINKRSIETTTADSSGRYTFKNGRMNLAGGESISVVSTDSAGNESRSKEVQTVALKDPFYPMGIEVKQSTDEQGDVVINVRASIICGDRVKNAVLYVQSQNGTKKSNLKEMNNSRTEDAISKIPSGIECDTDRGLDAKLTLSTLDEDIVNGQTVQAYIEVELQDGSKSQHSGTTFTVQERKQQNNDATVAGDTYGEYDFTITDHRVDKGKLIIDSVLIGQDAKVTAFTITNAATNQVVKSSMKFNNGQCTVTADTRSIGTGKITLYLQVSIQFPDKRVRAYKLQPLVINIE